MQFFIDTLKQAISLLLSLGIIGVLAFAFREYLKRYIDYVFKKRESEIVFSNTVDIEMLKSFVPIFSEIIELIYKMRNYARDTLERESPVTNARELYTDCCTLFMERLYKYRAFLDRDVFALLHRFKRHNQDFLMLLDVSDRTEELRANEARFSPERLNRLRSLFNNIDELYSTATTVLQEKIHVISNKENG